MANGGGGGEKIVTPLIRWAGSKRRLLPHLADYWAAKEHARYIEPFAGSGALFFHLQPKKALLNDINVDLINTYGVLAKQPEDVHRIVSAMPSDEVYYYKVRAWDPSSLSDIDRAARFIYLNRYCFNGIYRTNRKGDFNVPYGAKKAGALPSLQKFLAAASLLRRARFSSLDFEKFLDASVSRDDFVYLDPPYAVANRRVFRQYDPNTFGTEDVDRLSSLLELINKRKASFVVSYAYSAEIKPLLKRWRSKRVMAQRNVAGFTEHRRKAVEVVITNLG